MGTNNMLAFALLSVISLTSGLYFHIGETEKKCFIEEIPDETMVVGHYKVEMFDRNVNDYVPTVYGLGMHVEVTDPEDKTVMSRDYLPSAPGVGMLVEVKDPEGGIVLSRTYAADGRFTFTSHNAGEHVICLHSNSTAWFSSGQLRVHLDIQVGEHAVDYSQIQAKDKLSELQLRIRQLLDQVEQITKEQNYQRYREERFRQTSESTNQRVLYWSIAQTIILLITGFWQMRHLKSFFEAKKLV
ncbi:transmembrane emp24 domain-containing protein eca-like isoform X2 [Saccostrea echinata]|uniref:transmembrane emp24 domain-containing protein eca-like isoform X2 n=1 Tax=Saccostrea echinata TaxID=191078 RepID=UPI002A7F5B10|nr:transmembrane emp24 domain-containing protein eca-like isoform X2 [Saccostrea echinata]